MTEYIKKFLGIDGSRELKEQKLKEQKFKELKADQAVDDFLNTLPCSYIFIDTKETRKVLGKRIH